MSKNIVVLSDGTGQEGGKGTPTNVYKVFNMLEDRTQRQVTFYDRGLGTGWRKLTGKLSGMGISRNIRECYEFIFENFEAGDRVFLFGFSRGATTVRSLSSFIHHFGILPKSRPELIKQAYGIYKTRDPDKRNARAEGFVKRHHTMWTRIRFLGVWDTVAALGLPLKPLAVLLDKVPWFRHSFHNLELSEAVEHARHALAIDDERQTFHPKIWDPKINEAYQTLKQVWFCGMHTGVGGGYEEPQLSDIALIWMVEEAKAQGLLIYPKHKIKVAPAPNGRMYDSRGKGWTRLFRQAVRTWPVETHGKPVVHASVKLRNLNPHNECVPPYEPWILKMDHEVEPWPEDLRNSGSLQ